MILFCQSSRLGSSFAISLLFWLWSYNGRRYILGDSILQMRLLLRLSRINRDFLELVFMIHGLEANKVRDVDTKTKHAIKILTY